MKSGLNLCCIVAVASFLARIDGKGCFRGDMRVSMADGTLKRIDQINSGDVVVSWDDDLQRWSNATVQELIMFERTEIARITLGVDGASFARDLIATVDHPFYSHRTHSLVSLEPAHTFDNYELEAQLMHPDEIFQDMFGQPVSASVERLSVLSQPIQTFTLCLDPTHWFFIEGVRVHNKGCFSPTTMVLMGDGSSKQLSEILPGDNVTSWSEAANALVNATVNNLISFSRQELMQVELESGDVIFATPDHPFWSERKQGMVSLVPHQTRQEYQLDVTVLEDTGEVFHDARSSVVHGKVSQVLLLDEETTVMTLCLENPHWFFVGQYNSFVRVHNKGCFRGNTLVTLEDGSEREIMNIKEGEYVLSWDGAHAARAKVLSVVEFQRQEFVELEVHVNGMTRSIFSTPEHPFWSPVSKTEMSFDPESTKALYGLAEVVQMHEQDKLLGIDGALTDVKRKRSFSIQEKESVYTLMLEDRHYFFAESVLVHNKGGGSSGGGSSGGSRGGTSSSGSGFTSSGARYGTTSTGLYIASGFLFTSLLLHRPYYYSSPNCQSNPNSPGCKSSSGVVCGCPEQSKPGVQNFEAWENGDLASTINLWGYEYCSSDVEAGVCVSDSINNRCIPERYVESGLTSDKKEFEMVTGLLAIACEGPSLACNNDTSCQLALNNLDFQRSLYRNSSLITNATSSVQALAACMNANVTICKCDWEVCVEEESDAAIAGIVFGTLAGLVALGCCCFFLIKNQVNKSVDNSFTFRSASSSGQVNTCLHNHSLERTDAQAVALKTQDSTYLDGFVCDRCTASFPPRSELFRCNTCNRDFCPSCEQLRKPVRVQQTVGTDTVSVQMAPPLRTYSAEGCLGASHPTRRTTAAQMAKSDRSYKGGVVCDKCKGLFPSDAVFNRCDTCGFDFCDACLEPFGNESEDVKDAEPVSLMSFLGKR